MAKEETRLYKYEAIEDAETRISELKQEIKEKRNKPGGAALEAYNKSMIRQYEEEIRELKGE